MSIAALVLLVVIVVLVGVVLGGGGGGGGGAQKTPPPLPPAGFLWGGATSAFQIEGNLTEGGRGASIWDTFIAHPEKVGYPDLACNSYWQFRDDIEVLKKMGANAYRLSIAWPRIVPGGTLLDPQGKRDDALVNAAGVAYYRAVFKACREAGITPIVTLYHWDLPSALQDAYGGWLCATSYVPGTNTLQPRPTPDTELAIVTDFANYAEACFRAFGDLVDHWATINEPQTIAVDCYEFNWYAPGAGTDDGNAPTGIDYLAAHNLLLAHAGAVQRFRALFGAASPQKVIGMACNMDWAEPLDPDSPSDVAAAQRANVFWGGWFWDPLFFGNYPAEMRALVPASRLPSFTAAQSKALRGSMDIMMWNTYSTSYVTAPETPSTLVGWTYDQQTTMTPIGRDGKLIGTVGQSTWLHMVPWGAAACLAWIQNRYSRPAPSAPGAGLPGAGLLLSATETGAAKRIPLFITENGFDIANQGIDTSATSAVQDCQRTQYLESYFRGLAGTAAKTGVQFAGYLPWSLLDNLEWTHGFTARFGMTYMDFTDAKGVLLEHGGRDVKLVRVPKASALALRNIIASGFQR